EEGSSPSTGEVTEPSTDEEGSSPSTGEDRDDDRTTPNTDGGDGDDDGNGSGSGRCKKGFTYIRRADSCYWFSNYTAQWYDAECACASLGGTLAVINNEIEQTEISGRLLYSSWIGLNDNKLEDDFVWRDGSEVTFTKWSLDGSMNSEEKNCVELSENYNFSWVAENCEEQRRFVCEEAETEEQITTPVCPMGWTLNEETNTCYFISDKKLPWAAAKLLCSDIGGVLAPIHNKNAIDFLKNMMSKAGENAWIGCQTDDSGRWSWNDGSSLDFTNWGSGEPKTSSGLISTLLGGSKNFCGQMDYIQSFWSAKDCSSKLKAICRRLPEFLPRTVCPEGWTFDGEGNCFMVSSSEADFETAQKACNLSSVGGKLVIPNTDNQNSFVADFLKKNNIKKVWAGATVEEASKFTFGFIRGIIHTLFGFDNKNCIQIDETGTWSAQSCDYTSRFVCKVSKFKAHVMEKLNFIP
ncbi:C-type mannose receptor 2, partial [Armadillidium vulgare]